MKRRVGILTNFTGTDQSFSLINVVSTQVEMLLNGGYYPVVFVASTFPKEDYGIWSGSRVEIRRVAKSDDSADVICNNLIGMIADIDVMLCHDIVFLSNYAEWGKAVRRIAGQTNMTWIHWQHSRGDGKVEPCYNSWYAYPNNGDLEHVAKLNGTKSDRVRYVPHPLDFAYLGWPDLAIKIAEDFNFPFVDVSVLLPVRPDRQKQLEKAIRLVAGIKKSGKSVCFLVADASATGPRFVTYKNECKELAKSLDLTDKEFAFLGETYEECTFSTPRPVIKALFEMSNLFIQPSNAETSSLVAMEAALAGNLLVINSDFAPIAHLYQKALSLPFGSIFEDTKYYKHITLADGTVEKVEDDQQFWDDEAVNTVVPILDRQIAIDVKRQQFADRWPSRVFEQYLEPLILEVSESSALFVNTGDKDVTAIITTLDNLPLLERQLDVLRGEVGRVIVVNNGSKDGTKEYIDNLEYDWIDVINRDNKGAGPGRNSGLDMWNFSTQYTLMLDGGILPPKGGVAAMKDYLERHDEVDSVSPEVATCFTTEWKEATLIFPGDIPDNMCFAQRCLSGTAYGLYKAHCWDDTRFSEEGPFGEPGWGVDDNDMAYRWNDAGLIHHDFTKKLGVKLYRRASGSFKRLFEETGIWPNQYGSVYEARNVKCFQDWRKYHAPLYGFSAIPTVSHVFVDPKMPEFARQVKQIHKDDKNAEIVVNNITDPDTQWWIDTFALRWEWGHTSIDPDGNVIKKGQDYPEELWSGNVVTNRGPVGETIVYHDG